MRNPTPLFVTFLLALSGATLLSGCGGGTTANCRAEAMACAVSADCCNPLVCSNNLCATHACAPKDTACANTPDCCTGLACVAGKCAMPVVCAKVTEVCAATTDCCNPGVCTGGKCGAGPCRNLGDACAVANDCCGGNVCTNGKCAVAPTCKAANLLCADTTECCTPLVCLNGKCGASTATLSFKFTDSCNNGEAVQYRLFDDTNMTQWPPKTTDVYTMMGGQTVQTDIMCTPGDKICYGANQPTHKLFWGTDIDNMQGCNNCCTACAMKTISASFTCP